MIVEHISLLSGDSTPRNTNDILPETRTFFRALGTGEKIPNTRFTLRVVDHPVIGVFDLLIEENLVTTNVGCYGASGREIALNHMRSLSRSHPVFANIFHSMKQPMTDQFLITMPIGVGVATPMDWRVAGEIEFYIYESLRK